MIDTKIKTVMRIEIYLNLVVEKTIFKSLPYETLVKYGVPIRVLQATTVFSKPSLMVEVAGIQPAC